MLRVWMSVVVLLLVLVSGAAGQTSSPRTDAPVKPVVVVNLNTATVADLEKLPGIGAKTAQRILDYRQKNGPFKKIEELMNVQGIGEKSFLRLRSQLVVGAAAGTSSSPQ